MWARIENACVCEVTERDPAGRFSPALIWIPCPEDTQPGWYYDAQAGRFGVSPPAQVSGGTEDARIEALERAQAVLALEIAALKEQKGI